jgi:hypothetical protein
MTDAATLRALIERVEGATGADGTLDRHITQAAYPDLALAWCEKDEALYTQTHQRLRVLVMPYTSSLDAAASLYPVRPAMIPSCPRKATADALRARLAEMEAQDDG